jgi:hypothetical protein
VFHLAASLLDACGRKLWRAAAQLILALTMISLASTQAMEPWPATHTAMVEQKMDRIEIANFSYR